MDKETLAKLESEHDKGLAIETAFKKGEYGKDYSQPVIDYANSLARLLNSKVLSDYVHAINWKIAGELEHRDYQRRAFFFQWLHDTVTVLALAVSQATSLTSEDTLTGLTEAAKELVLECSQEALLAEQFDCFVVAWLKCAYHYCITNGHTEKARFFDPGHTSYGNNDKRLKEIREYLEKRISILDSFKLPVLPPVLPQSSRSRSPNNRTIFVVYGHDTELKNEVMLALTRLRFNPIDLAEKPAGGLKSILEKFEDNAETAGFAVALLTADDIGGKKGDEQKPRGRQNVILEIGYFIGKLGPENVCVICDDGIEIPSDILGQHYLKRSEWQLHLVRELTKAKYVVDVTLL